MVHFKDIEKNIAVEYTILSKTNCTEEDKKACLPLIRELMHLGGLTYKLGDGAFRAYAEKTKGAHPYITLGLNLIKHGTSLQLQYDILSNHIISTPLSPKEALELVLIRDALIYLQKSYDSFNLRELLLSNLGLEYSMDSECLS